MLAEHVAWARSQGTPNPRIRPWAVPVLLTVTVNCWSWNWAPTEWFWFIVSGHVVLVPRNAQSPSHWKVAPTGTVRVSVTTVPLT